jgi:multidrug efflux system membrane fusion protein
MPDTYVNLPESGPVDRRLEPSHRPAPDVDVRNVPPAKGKRGWVTILIVLILGALALFAYKRSKQTRDAAAQKTGMSQGRPGAGMPVPIIAGTVTSKDVPIYLDGLGTVQAFNTVTVRTRVDGAVEKILFTEGQDVHAGDLLAQIDAAPFQAQVDQALAKKAEDEAQLNVARVNLKRDVNLLASKILSQQDYDTQQALVQQLEATVKADQANVENAQVQLAYTRITSALEGRVGMRQVDPGNIVHPSDTNGLVVITQLRPISVIFTLPEQNLAEIQLHGRAGERMQVLAVDRNNQQTLDQGQLAVIDNQIDTSTGTIRLKGTFPNTGLRLWPGQFVNARLLLTTRKAAAVVPAQVIQRGPEGAYAYVIRNDDTVAVQTVRVAQVEGGEALVEEGLQSGERVVVEGQYKLRPGAKVRIENGAPGQGGRPAQGTRPGQSGRPGGRPTPSGASASPNPRS